ncbi:MAG: methylenetetrahydrofolate reductase [bacterium]|nr:methylenetetrahydrofolate reductase [Bacillota bacterium]HHW54634.1 5,10-methylenetetrahydrofolate reductase [Bacillota bacterium]
MRLREALASGKVVITAEVAPPKGTDLTAFRESLPYLKGRVDAVNVTDFQSAVVRASSLTLCHLLLEEGLEPVLQITGRDRNRIAIQGELLGAAILGIENVLAITGDHTEIGDDPGAKPVFDLDAVTILQAAKSLSQGRDLAGNPLQGAPDFTLGATVTPCYEPLELQVLKMESKLAAGATFFQTQAVYEVEVMRRFREATAHLGDVKVLVGIIPLKSAGMARFMNKNVPGIRVPEELIEGIEEAPDPVAAGVEAAGELMAALLEEGLCDGFHLMTLGREDLVPGILAAAGLA